MAPKMDFVLPEQTDTYAAGERDFAANLAAAAPAPPQPGTRAEPSALDRFAKYIRGTVVDPVAQAFPEGYAALRGPGAMGGAGLELAGLLPPVRAGMGNLNAGDFATALGLQPKAPTIADAGPAVTFGAGTRAGTEQEIPTRVGDGGQGYRVPTAPAPVYGMTGGMGQGSSPMAGLAGAVNADNREMLDTYKTGMYETIHKGNLEAKQQEDVAAAQMAIAARAEREARLREQADEDAATFARDFTTKSAAKVAAVAEMKLDPNRIFAASGIGDRLMFILGGALGGSLQAIGATQKNEFMEQVQRAVNEDLDVQEKEIAGKNREIAQRDTILGQFQSIHGNQRLGRIQGEEAMLGASKQYLLAQSDSDNLPAQSKNNALILANGINQQQVALKTQIDRQLLQTAQAQAAAQYAARVAAEKQAWERAKDVQEFHLKERAQNREDYKAQQEAGGGSKEERMQDRRLEQQGLEELAKRLATPEIVEANVAIANAKRRLMGPDGKIDPTKGMPGVGPGANVRETIAPPMGQGGTLQQITQLHPGTALPSAAIRAIAGLTPEERTSRQDWSQLQTAYKVRATGAGASLEEVKSLKAEFEGANTPAEQANAIAKADAIVATAEARIRAGFSPQVNAIFDARMGGNAAPPMPASVKMK